MTVKQLIERLQEFPPHANVYVGDLANGVEERGWDGSAEDVIEHMGAVFIEFNETGYNNFIDTEVRG
ncbi:hypothetical protein ACU4IU_00270 [Brevibacterium sp. CSND-B09]|uniref:hypothetical protein n=1 Tax=Brevibacterium sp. CSND-B09 TaxID=3462571 RepID=UPI00406A6761